MASELLKSSEVQKQLGRGLVISQQGVVPAMRAGLGSWIIWLSIPHCRDPHYIASITLNGEMMGLSTRIYEAKGFTYQKAKELMNKLNKSPDTPARLQIVQRTTEHASGSLPTDGLRHGYEQAVLRSALAMIAEPQQLLARGADGDYRIAVIQSGWWAYQIARGGNKTCSWQLGDSGQWRSGCGQLMRLPDTPSLCNLAFCGFCGSQLSVQDNDDEYRE